MAEIVNALREFAKYCTMKSATHNIIAWVKVMIWQEINWSHVHPVGPVPAVATSIQLDS